MIRKVKINDAGRVAALMKQLGYPCTIPEMKQRLELVTKKKRFCGYVFEEAGKILGVVIAHRFFSFSVGSDVLRIQVLVIDKGYQRKGAGHALLEKMEEVAKKRNMRIRLSQHISLENYLYSCFFNSILYRFNRMHPGTTTTNII